MELNLGNTDGTEQKSCSFELEITAERKQEHCHSREIDLVCVTSQDTSAHILC